MHRNTFLFIVLLALFTALLLGLQVGKFTKKDTPISPSPSITPTPTLVFLPEPTTSSPSGSPIRASSSGSPKPTSLPTASPSASTLFTSSPCGITFTTTVPYSAALEGSNAILTNSNNANDMIAISCQSETIARPSVAPEQRETKTLKGGIQASLYHETTNEEKSTVDILIFRHPNLQKDIFIATTGPSMSNIIATLSLLP